MRWTVLGRLEGRELLRTGMSALRSQCMSKRMATCHEPVVVGQASRLSSICVRQEQDKRGALSYGVHERNAISWRR